MWNADVFADAYIPLSPVAPVLQCLLLVLIVALEGKIIQRDSKLMVRPLRFWAAIAAANVVTALLGLLLAFPIAFLESLLALWPNGSQNLLVFRIAFPIAVLLSPWMVWALCYQISWRTEARLLAAWVGERNNASFREVVRKTHRRSYAVLGLFVLFLNVLWLLMAFGMFW